MRKWRTQAELLCSPTLYLIIQSINERVVSEHAEQSVDFKVFVHVCGTLKMKRFAIQVNYYIQCDALTT